MNDWHLRKLGDVAKIVSGATPKTKIPEYWDGDILWATPKDLGQLREIEIEGTERKITKAGYESCSTRLLPVGSVLLSSRAPIGHLAINTKPICTNQGFKSLIPKNGLYNRYLYWVLKASVPELQGLGRGCTFDEISKGLVESFEIPVPPIDEQRRIVTRIEELTRRAEEARKLRQEAVAQIATQFFHIRRKIYQSLLSEFPTKSLRKCGKVIGGGTPSKQRADYWDGDIPWVSAKDMKAFFLTDSGLKITKRGLSESSAKLIPENSVLFVVRGSILYRYVPIAVNSMPCTINQDLKAIIPAKGINAIYLAHMLWAANDILLGMVEEAGNTAGKLPTPSWSELDIPIPDETKQESVVKELTALQEKLLELESLQAETAQELEQFQTALLAKAFRGEL